MRRLIVLAMVLLAAPVLAQKPWEQRVDLPVGVPIELPAVPPTNPFAAALVSPPAVNVTPLRDKFTDTFVAQAAAYIDAEGVCRRVVFTRLPWPGLGADLQQAIMETTFTPARARGTPVPVWMSLAIDLRGRVDRGRVVRAQGLRPDPAVPPVPETAAAPVPDAHDLSLPATATDQVEQLPTPKRFRARIDGKTWSQGVKLLAQIGPDGHCQRVVFLAWPEGLRNWLLTSMGAWQFRPAQGKDGPTGAWVQLEGEIEVELGDLASDAMRVTRQSSYPHAVATGAVAHPPGG